MKILKHLLGLKNQHRGIIKETTETQNKSVWLIEDEKGIRVDPRRWKKLALPQKNIVVEIMLQLYSGLSLSKYTHLYKICISQICSVFSSFLEHVFGVFAQLYIFPHSHEGIENSVILRLP